MVVALIYIMIIITDLELIDEQDYVIDNTMCPVFLMKLCQIDFYKWSFIGIIWLSFVSIDFIRGLQTQISLSLRCIGIKCKEKSVNFRMRIYRFFWGWIDRFIRFMNFLSGSVGIDKCILISVALVLIEDEIVIKFK